MTLSYNDYKYLGCYEDKGPRLLSKSLNPKSQSVKACLDMAKKRGYMYAGSEFGGECWASNTKPVQNKRIGYDKCYMTCNDDGKTICGGPSVSVFDHPWSFDWSSSPFFHIIAGLDSLSPRELDFETSQARRALFAHREPLPFPLLSRSAECTDVCLPVICLSHFLVLEGCWLTPLPPLCPLSTLAYSLFPSSTSRARRASPPDRCRRYTITMSQSSILRCRARESCTASKDRSRIVLHKKGRSNMYDNSTTRIEQESQARAGDGEEQ